MNMTSEMERVPIGKLIPYINNARTHSPEQIKKLRASLREFGFINPVIIDRDYNVIAGHGRIMAAKEEGITEVPCVYVDHLTEAQRKAYILADNRMALDAGWDEELLRVEIDALREMDFDPMLAGFDEKELAALYAGDGDGAEDDDFDLSAALEKAAFVQPGDIWTVGRHRLMCGDATKPEDVRTLMGDERANLIVTDPPYGVSFKSASGLTIQNDSIKDEEFYGFLLAAFQGMADVLEKGGAAYIFHADTEGLNFRRAFIDAGFHLAGVCIWVKNSLVLGRSDYQWQHEPVLYGFLQNGSILFIVNDVLQRTETCIFSAYLAKKGVTGPRNIIDGVYGFYHQYIKDECDKSRLLERMGDIYWITTLSYKVYPVCGQCLSSVSTVDQIMKDNAITADEITGMDNMTFQPAAGAHGELTGMMVIKKYFEVKGDKRKKVIIPDSAHGTNPASAHLCGFDIVPVKSNDKGQVDIEELKRLLDSDVAAIMKIGRAHV